MDDDILSQNEMNSLLTEMKAQTRSAAVRASRAQPATPYDFKKPERVGKEQIQVLQSLHEVLARNFGAALSGLLRCMVEVNLASVEQLPYSEFVFSLENPTCFNVVRADPLEGNLILDMGLSVAFPIIDRLLGGGKESAAFARRPLTDLEQRLIARATQLFLAELKNAWRNVLELNVSVDRVESNPQLVQIVSPNEAVVLVIFEIAIGDSKGIINLCIPYNAIEPHGAKLQSNSWASSFSRSGGTPQTKKRIGQQLRRSEVEMLVTLAQTKITTADLLGLRVGDIVTTTKDAHAPLEVSIEGVSKFLAIPGAFKGRKAVQISGDAQPQFEEC